MAALFPPLNCSLVLPPTAVPSQTYLKEDGATASPSCLGGGLLCVGATMAPSGLIRAYLGLQATQVGRISLPLSKSTDIIHSKIMN